MIDTDSIRCKIFENMLKGKFPDMLIADGTATDLITCLSSQKDEWIKNGLVKKIKRVLQ